jgi:superfamily II DNA or RNA helicase
MKCLDEGIDVKQTKCAIFCASTGNPRQFIQRRGRVLRTHSSKTFARIYDIVVFPNFVDGEDKVNKLNSNMIKRELQRVLDFANDAVNSTHALEVLQTPCAKFNIQVNQLL